MEEQNNNKEEALISAITDICARSDLVASSMVNAVTAMMNAVANLSNTKNYYLELVGKLKQEKEREKAESISSK
jgi:hypothetical protein